VNSITNQPPRSFLRPITWVIAFGGLLLLFLQPWAPRNPALDELKEQWTIAHRTRNLTAMEALFHGDNMDDATRSRWRTVILQEFDLRLRSVKMKSLPDEVTSAPQAEASFTPVAQMTVYYDDPNRFTVTYLIGKNPSGVHRILLFNP
jgi:hypothetical protein